MDSHPPCDVVIRLETGAEHVICHPTTIDEHREAGRSWSTWAGTEQLLELVQRAQRAIPGARVTSPRAAEEYAEREAALRLAAYEAEHRAQDARCRQRGRPPRACILPASPVAPASGGPPAVVLLPTLPGV